MFDRCNALSSRESDYLMGFWNRNLSCFSIFPDRGNSTDAPPARASITSSCLALETMLQNPEHWKRLASWDDENSVIRVNQVMQSLYNTVWSGDPFQTPILLQALCNFKSLDKNDPKFVNAVNAVLNQRAQLSLHRKQPNSAYLRFCNVRALLAIVESDNIPDEIYGSGKVRYALERANLVAGDELSRQLSFYFADDSANFDVIVLAYSLLAYWRSSHSTFVSGFARGVVAPTNYKLVASALHVVFEQQKSDGTWIKGEPIFRQGGRDIGNSYVFFFDLVGGLLSSGLPTTLLSQYLENFERCLTWAEENVLEEMLPEVCDPVTGRCTGNLVRGWRSNHLDTGGAVCWCTAQVFFALGAGEGGLGGLLKKLITSSVLDEFGGVSGQGGGGNADSWNRLMDTDVKLSSGETSTLKNVVRENFLQPQKEKQASLARAFTSGSSSSSLVGVGQSQPLYSCILFGPPGTAKTTICSSMARYLGWNFVTVDTARFLKNGLENVASTMTYIFERLGSLEQTIILFDEIEEFCLDRENTAIGMESRLLTTAMLTQLNGLRSKQKCIFIVATNRLRSFDAAVTRPGRFDALLFVGTPNMESRMRRLGDRLPASAASSQKALDAFEAVLKERWNDEARFCSFAENEALINFARDEARVAGDACDKEALEAKLSAKLDGLLKTATIQGPVRDEYMSSENLSRL